MALDKAELGGVNAHVENVVVEGGTEKVPVTAYARDERTNSHHKSPLERRLVLKADLVIVPLAALIYFVAYLDRNCIGNARLMGLQTDLNMSNQGYYNCVTMFFVGYIIFMLPSNILLRKVTPHILLGGTVITFGVLLCGMSAAPNYQTVLALRILIGSSQAFIQGVGLYNSLWYRRDEIATRSGVFYSAATISGAFSGLISYGITTNLTAQSTGRSPWRWLFIIEGVMAIGVGVLTWLVLPRFPDRMKNGQNWLFSKDEVLLAIERSASYNTTGAKLELKQIWIALRDPKSWAFAFINAGIVMGVSTISVFLPGFIQAFGYTAARAQLFSTIPYACATVMLVLICIASDRYNRKGVFLLFCLTLSCVGYILLLTVSSVTVKMVATCFVTSGLYPGVIVLVAWLGINTGGFTKRGTTWALAEVVGQCFRIMGTNVYTDGPRYVKGHSIVLAFMVLAMCNAAGLMLWMGHENRRKEREEAEFAGRGELHPHLGKSLEEVYDYHISFRYIL